MLDCSRTLPNKQVEVLIFPWPARNIRGSSPRTWQCWKVVQIQCELCFRIRHLFSICSLGEELLLSCSRHLDSTMYLFKINSSVRNFAQL
eukprot:g12637.t1